MSGAARVVPLSRLTLAVITRLFAQPEQEAVRTMLTRDCGGGLPLTDRWGEPQFERLWLAVLQISGGDITRVRETIALAQVDWRDVLVGAGFGHSLEAHRRWATALTS